jgi:hypothetical protein
MLQALKHVESTRIVVVGFQEFLCLEIFDGFFAGFGCCVNLILDAHGMSLLGACQKFQT